MPQFLIHGPSGLSVSMRIDGERILVGRSPSADVLLPIRVVSRRHAEIQRKDGGWWVEDLGSRHGTLHNGKALERSERLSVGDELSFGPARVVVQTFEVASPGEDALSTAAGPLVVLESPKTMVGSSSRMQHVRSLITKVADSAETILITGETGTGKELAARMIHERSSRRKGPFRVVNCPALQSSLVESELFGVAGRTATGVDPRAGLLELADGGTLFFDEVGDLDIGAQAKLLRFLDDHTFERVGGRSAIRVDTRVLAATNRDLGKATETGEFRLDFYHRLNTVAVTLPPLRDRREDIRELVEHFLSLGPPPHLQMSDDALRVLEAYTFPGNVRELQRMLTRVRLFVEGGVITPSDLPELGNHSGAGKLPQSVEDIALALHTRITEQRESFWELVQEPYLRRALAPEVAIRLLEYAYEKEGRSKRKMARAFHMRTDKEYKKLVAFVRNHRLL